MKNLFLTIAFALGTATSFAGGNIVAEDGHCIGVSLSCGVSYEICNFSGTTTQLVNSILNSNNNVCGTNFEML